MWQRRRSSGFVRENAEGDTEGLDEDEAAFEHMEEIRARAEAAELESGASRPTRCSAFQWTPSRAISGALTVNFS